ERGEPREERAVIVDPVQRRVREHEVERARGLPALDRGALEGETLARVRRALREHRRGGIDPDRLARGEALVEDGRELARAAAEIDDAHARPRRDEREEVEERPAALVLEALVLTGIPLAHARRISGVSGPGSSSG